MGVKNVLLIALACSSCTSFAQDVTVPSPTPTDSSQETAIAPPVPVNVSSFVRVKFYLSENGSLQLASELIAKNVTTYNITIRDIVEVTQVDKFNFSQVSVLLDKFDVTSADLCNFRTLEVVFKQLNISILAVYQELKNSLADPRNDIPKVLEILGIDSVRFNDIIAYGTDEELFNFLKQQNITAESVQKVYETLGKTPSDTYEFIKGFVFAKIGDYDLQLVVSYLQSLGISAKQFQDVLKEAGVRKEDFYRAESFRKAFFDFVKVINEEEYLGIVLNLIQVTSVKSVENRWRSLRDYANIFVENIDNSSIPVQQIAPFDNDCSYGPIILSVNQRSAENNTFIITDEYDVEEIEKCTYVTLINGTSLVSEDVSVFQASKQNIIAKFTNSSIFKVGSPLFCKSRLYGLAEQKQGDNVGFRTFFCDPEESDATTILPENGGRVNAGGFLACAAVLGLLCWFRV